MKFLKVAVAAALISVPAHAATIATPFSSYFALGDSLTDDGKFGMLFPPSAGGRFSNGPTYAERIGGRFTDQGKFYDNLAIGGATAGDVNPTVYPPGAAGFGTLKGQATYLENNIVTPTPAPVIGADPLVSVLMGANDLLGGIAQGISPVALGVSAAEAVITGIQQVANIGAAFDSFLVLNMPNLSLTPRFADTANAADAATASISFNSHLDDRLDDLRNNGLEIIEFDLNATFEAAVSGGLATQGITDTTTPCAPTLFAASANCATTPSGGVDLTLADSFFFVDTIHPNRVVHQELFSQIQSTIVPLPAGVWLLLGGLGALARRKRAT